MCSSHRVLDIFKKRKALLSEVLEPWVAVPVPGLKDKQNLFLEFSLQCSSFRPGTLGSAGQAPHSRGGADMFE